MPGGTAGPGQVDRLSLATRVLGTLFVIAAGGIILFYLGAKLIDLYRSWTAAIDGALLMMCMGIVLNLCLRVVGRLWA